MPGNELGDRVHNFFAEDNSSQVQHQSHVLEGNWPVLNSNYWAGSQRQIDILNSSSKNHPSQNSEIDRQASYPVHVARGLNSSQSNLRPDTYKPQYVSEQQYSNGVVFGNQLHQNRHNGANFLAVDTVSNQHHLLSSRGLSFPGTQQESDHEQGKASDRLETSLAPVSFDLFGGQPQMNHQQASMLQALQRQQSGFNDMQQMQQEIMMRKMQEFQMRQQLTQLDLRPQDLVNQVPAFTKQRSQTNTTYDNSNSDVFPHPWTAEPGTSWLNDSSSMQRCPSVVGSPQNMAQAQRSLDLVPQQDDQSLFGVPVSSARGLAANQYPQVVMSRSSMPQIEAFRNSLHGSPHNLLSDQIGAQESSPISRPKIQLENIGHTSSQSLNIGITDKGLPHQVNSMPKNEPHGRQEPPAQSGTSHERSTWKFCSSSSEAALDPAEEKILYGSDDNIWSAFGKSPNMSGDTTGNLFDNGGLLNGFPSIQSGSWSALMQSAVAETSSSDICQQEEWSGLNFHSYDGSSANRALMHNDNVNRASLPENEVRIPSALNSGSVRSSEAINTGNALVTNQHAHNFLQKPGLRVSTDASQQFRQSSDEFSKWSNRNTLQKPVAEGSQINENASQHYLDAERTIKKVSATRVPGQTGTAPEENGWNAQAAVSPGGDEVKNYEAQFPQKLQNNRSMVMQDVHGSSLWKTNSPRSAIDCNPGKVGNHLADKGLLSLNHVSASAANTCNMGLDDGNSLFVLNNNLLNQWKNAHHEAKFQGSDCMRSNKDLDSSNRSNKDEVRRLDVENIALKENSSDVHRPNLSQHTSGGFGEAGFYDACDSRLLAPGKQKITNPLASKVSVPRKFQYHPMGNLDEEVEPKFGLKQPMPQQSSSLQNTHFVQASQVSRFSASTDEGELPKNNKGNSNEPTRGSLYDSASRISFPFNRPLDSYSLNKASSPSQNMLELLHKVDQSRNDGAVAHLSSSDCNISSQLPEAEKSEGSAGHIQHSSVSKGFGLQLGPPSQRMHPPDLSLLSQNARDMANSMHTNDGSEMRDNKLQASSVQSVPVSNEGSLYENLRTAGAGNLGVGNSPYKMPGSYQLALDTPYSSSQLQHNHLMRGSEKMDMVEPIYSSFRGITGDSIIQESGPAATTPTRDQIHSSQHLGMPGNSQQFLHNIWNNISSSQQSLASQYPKAPSHFAAPHQPNIVESSPHADLRNNKGNHLPSGFSSIHASIQGVVDKDEHRLKASAGQVAKIDSTEKIEETLGITSSIKDDLEESPVNSASTQKDIEAFGRSLKPNTVSNKNYALLNQVSVMKDPQSDPGIRVSKRMKGPDNVVDVHQFHPEAGQQDEDNVGEMMGSSSGLSSEDSRMFRFSSSSEMLLRNTAPHGNIVSQDIAVAVLNASQINLSSDCTNSVAAENQQVGPQITPSLFNQYGHFNNGQMIPVYNAHNITSFRPSEPSFTVFKSSSIMDAPSLGENGPAASVGACQVGSTEKSASTLVTNGPLSSAQSLQLTVMDEHQVILRPQKRKAATSELLPWQKEISDGSQDFLVLSECSATESDWSKAANHLIEKVRDDPELNEDGSSLLRSKRRLVLTTQLMQQLFCPPPAIILSTDASSTYESVTYGASRVALGDACSAVSCSSDFGRRDCLDLHSMKGKLNGDPCFAKVIEELLGKAEKLEDDFLRLDKNASILDLRVECQELEKFSAINRFARFHGRSQNDNPEAASLATSSNLHMQRYVLALPMPKNLPERAQCLSL